MLPMVHLVQVHQHTQILSLMKLVRIHGLSVMEITTTCKVITIHSSHTKLIDFRTYTTNTNITMLRSSVLTDWDNADVKLVFDPPPGMNYSTDLWAPELHQIDNSWFVIFTADPNFDTPSPEVDMFCDFNCPAIHHRMYVLEGSSSDPWNSTYTLKSQLNTYDQVAIDGTYFQHDSRLYHI